MLPTVVFVLSMLMALATGKLSRLLALGTVFKYQRGTNSEKITGTSWGTMAILFPLTVFPAWQAVKDASPEDASEVLLGVIAAILSGAVRDHWSTDDMTC